MTKIPLRTYNREIEGMIDRGQTSQAVDHCLHILKFFPKHIDTYRLLGKAYLELQKYREAADVLQRVLACVPDDFISQIGMAIIREDEGNLDAAVCHMERAFEVQPSNIGVRDELRRLYGKRDGTVPEKIRLTRGALVRMYARGELYQQAIAEIRVALLEDPKRLDLETLLARMYFLSGQKVAATEVCSRLISKLPFCFEANRILAEVLSESARADDAKHYLARVHAMDPYLAHLTPEALTSAEVPDNAVELERLEWMPEESTQPAEWEKVAGTEYSMRTEAIPDWITGVMAEEESIQPEPSQEQPPLEEEAPKEEEEKIVPPFSIEIPFEEEPAAETPAPSEGADQIPEWMKQAGWQPASGEAEEQPTSSFEDEEQRTPDEEAEEIEQAEIPDWLAALAPAEEPEAPEEPEASERLLSILPEAPEAEGVASEFEEPAVSVADQVESDQVFDLESEGAEEEFLFSAGEQTEEIEPPGEEEESAEWLESPVAEASETEFQTGIAEEPAFESEAAETAEPFSVEPSAAPAEEIARPPDWLADLQAPAATPGEEGEEEFPSWLEELSLEAQEPQPERSEAPAEEWVKAGPFGATPKPEEEAAMEEPETTPETGAQMDLGDTQPVRLKRDETPAPTPEPQAEPTEETPTGEPDFEQTMSWLDRLTAEETGEPAPDWVQETKAGEEMPEGQTEEAGETAPEWVQEITAGEEAPEGQTEEAGETAPEWMRDLGIEEELPAGELPEAGPTTPDWMQEIAAIEAEEPEAEPTEAAIQLEPGEEELDALSPQEEALEESESIGAIFEEAFHGEEPVLGGAEFLEELPAAEEPSEESLPAAEEAAPEQAEMEIGPSDQFLAAFETLEPVQEISPDTPEETPAVFEVETGESEGLVPEAEPAAYQPEPVIAEPQAEPAEEELPDWLREMMSGEEELAAEPAATEAISPEEPAAEDAMSWIKELAAEEETPQEPLVSEIPMEESEVPAAHGAFIEEEAVLKEEGAPEEGLPEWLRGVDEEKSTEELQAEFNLDQFAAEVEGGEPSPEWSPEMETAGPVAEAEPSLEDTSPFKPFAETVETGPVQVLKQAQAALEANNVDRALENYEQLIQSGQYLEDIIHDLRDAVYRYPIDVGIWQLLGDAYMKSNRLQEALDAYTKAEELLR